MTNVPKKLLASVMMMMMMTIKLIIEAVHSSETSAYIHEIKR
jgi:hypothetical protein